MANPHSRVWFSPFGSEWEAETYEEALEMERDSLAQKFTDAMTHVRLAEQRAERERKERRKWEAETHRLEEQLEAAQLERDEAVESWHYWRAHGDRELRNERDRLAKAAVQAQDHLRPSHAAYRILSAALFPPTQAAKSLCDMTHPGEPCPAKERDPALCRHGYDLTQKDECPLCKAQEALSEWEPAQWCRRCGVYGCEHVLPAQSPASEPEGK